MKKAIELNTKHLFSTTDTEVLSEIAKSGIDIVSIAKRELENRGLDINGQWVGFNHTIA